MNESDVNTALLVIDVQQGLFKKSTPIYKANDLLINIQTLIGSAHKAKAPVIYIQHSNPSGLLKGSEEWQLHPALHPIPEDTLIHKLHGNAFEETELDATLKARGIKQLTITGLVTHGCVRATCLSARELGYPVTLVTDAHSSYSKDAARLIEELHKKLVIKGVELKPTREIKY